MVDLGTGCFSQTMEEGQGKFGGKQTLEQGIGRVCGDFDGTPLPPNWHFLSCFEK